MTRRKRQALAPTLFPFLAVLVCTLGTLILLLALVSQNAATAAEQRARQALTTAASPAATDRESITTTQAAALIDEATVRIESLQAARSAQAADLESRRDQLTHLEDHIGRLSEELTQLANEAATATAAATHTTDSEQKLAEIQQQIDQHQQQLDELRQQLEQTAPRVVIVPHRGPNGTTRRPIYVECTETGLTIWPEGVEIPTESLSERRSRGANPLDAALRVARLHTMQVYGDADPPYPLLIVRPHGTDAYFAATAAMHDWDDQYGYEMLDRGIELAVGPADPNLRRRMEAAIAAALERQETRPERGPVALSASQLARDGRNRGFGSHPGHGYGDGRVGGLGTNPAGNLAHQTQRLNTLYRQAAEELRNRDEGSGTEAGLGEPSLAEPSFAEAGLADAGLGEAGLGDAGDSGDAATSAGKPHQPSPRNASPRGAGDGGELGGTNPQPPPPHAAAVAAGIPSTEPAAEAAADTPRDPNVARQRRGSTAQLVQRTGANWALPSSVTAAQGISIVRSIQVECHPDRLVIAASRAEPRVVFPIHDDFARTGMEFATEIRDRIERWGVALNDGRWQPVLNVAVLDGAGHRLRQLSALLEGSGIEIVEGTQP